MKILGIEASCDDTAVAIIDDNKNILAEEIISQIDIHKQYGGVVPEIAARTHANNIDQLIKSVCDKANINLTEIDCFAATSGPGLIGGLIVGLMAAKTLAHCLNKPFIAINHLEGHLLMPRFSHDIEFPFLTLLISGGHCHIIIAKSLGDYEVIGKTLDDAPGEAFDKTAKMLGLDYPGGPIIERMANKGDPNKFSIAKPMIGKKNCDFSFSGLKTSTRNLINKQMHNGQLSQQDIYDICACLQNAIADSLADRINYALDLYSKNYNNRKLVISGGVAANLHIRSKLQQVCAKKDFELFFPSIKYCTDNAVMIAYAGLERFKNNLLSDFSAEPKPRWPLDQL